MTATPCSEQHEDRPRIEDWTEKLRIFLHSCKRSKDSLKGWSIRVRHSRREPYLSIGKAFEHVLAEYGAVITDLDKMEHALAVKGPRPLDEIDTFLMIAGTANVSAEAMELAHEKTADGNDLKKRTIVTLPELHTNGFIRKRLSQHKVNIQEYSSSDIVDGKLCIRIMNDIINMKSNEELRIESSRPTIGIITALPVEFEAMRAVLANAVEERKDDGDRMNIYVTGTLPAAGSGEHKIVLARSGVGNNMSAAVTERLFREFNVRDILMVGIAAGIPASAAGQEDVRLGDIVVSGRKGIIQYDRIKSRKGGKQDPAHLPMPPSRRWAELAETFISRENEMAKYNARLKATPGHKRPAASSDVLTDEKTPSIPIERAKRRGKIVSKAYSGAVGSANTVVKSQKQRDKLRKDYNILAIEMEGAGVADATLSNGRHFFVIRGICDYANHQKNDVWHPYAALAAAAFAATLIESAPLQRAQSDQQD